MREPQSACLKNELYLLYDSTTEPRHSRGAR
jgi:hypothetical protein